MEIDFTELLSKSEFLRRISQKDGKRFKSLTSSQIKRLEKNGNFAADWKKVKVSDGFNPERIRNSFFFGKVYVGSFKGVVEEFLHPTGIYNATVTDCKIEDDVLIKNVRLLSNYLVRKGAVLFDLGRVTCAKNVKFGNGHPLVLCIETGGRNVKGFAEIDLKIAAEVATRREECFLASYDRFIETYLGKINAEKGIIDESAVLLDTPTVENSYIGPAGRIDGACAVINSTILSNAEERTEVSHGGFVKNSILQWGSAVTTFGLCVNSVMAEHSHCERHGKVTESFIAPNSGVGEGEITSSLVGPFVGFHHQALLIAAYWPGGKGNVGYGANLGSNHPSRMPDQEVWCGEGIFFGLGVNIKYPADFSQAPYSIIATGVMVLPGKITFPFSLLNTPGKSLPGVSPAFSEIMPGWVLSDDIYTIKRNEGKYRKRNKARRTQFDFEVFRTDIVELMISGRTRLSNITETKDFYLEKDIPGLGKNYLLEANRKKGIETYSFYIKHYAAAGLLRKVKELISKSEKENLNRILDVCSDDCRWEHERGILTAEFPGQGVKEILGELKTMEEKIAADTQSSREKDDARGIRIIPDYRSSHTLARDDSFVKETWERLTKVKEEIDEIIAP